MLYKLSHFIFFGISNCFLINVNSISSFYRNSKLDISPFEDEVKYSNDENESVNDLTFKMHSYSDGKRIANENLLANKASKDEDSFNPNHNLNYDNKRNVTIKNSNVISKSAQAANTNINNQSLQLYHQETLSEQSINQSMLSNSTESLTIVDHNKPMVKCSIHSLNFDALLDACDVEQ